MDSLFTFITGLLTAALSLVGFVQTHPELPQSSRDQAVQVVQEAVGKANDVVVNQKSP